MLTWLFNHIMILAGFNLINAYWDAYRILRHKDVAHALNLGAYLTLIALVLLLNWPGLLEAVLFLLSALFNRQLSFDIPLNLRRGLSWDYQSTADPPAALMDRIERAFFDQLPGRWIAALYAAFWLNCTLIKAFVK